MKADADEDPFPERQGSWRAYWYSVLVRFVWPLITSIPTVLPGLPRYDMTSRFAGLAVIVTNDRFEGEGGIRQGCDVDESKIMIEIILNHAWWM